MRHKVSMGLRVSVVTVGACLTLSGCFGSGSSEPTAADTSSASAPDTPSGSPSASSPTTGSSNTSPTTAPTSASTADSSATLSFSPPSNGKHSHTCYAITGTTPVDYVYYPVLVKTSATATLDSAAVTYADGVQVAGSWVAPASSQQGTGTVEGWPAPAILVQGNSVQWSKKVPAAGATLDPATGWYNVFLHLRVYPDSLPLKTDGVVLTYHDESGAKQTVTWVDHLTFAAKC